MAAALEAADPGWIVRNHLETNPLPTYERIFLLGIGKASEPMTRAAAGVLTNFAEALIITKHASYGTSERIRIMEAGHPLPDERSLAAGRAVLEFVSRLRADDLLVCLISGGGSALVAAPRQGIGLEDLQQLTADLLACGASIEEINILRRELDQIKGGGLARATKAQIYNLILSDVIDDKLEIIASGPTVPNPTTLKDAQAVLKKYSITPAKSIQNALRSPGREGKITSKRIRSTIIGNNLKAIQAAQLQAQSEGFQCDIIDTALKGEAREVGVGLAKILKDSSFKKGRSFCLLAGGETTVTLHGNGNGGRNQELALAAVDQLAGIRDIMLIALATDGNDGPTEAAGAVVTGGTCQRAEKMDMNADDYLSQNNSYAFFEALGDLLKPGYTGTNVNDLVFMFGF